MNRTSILVRAAATLLALPAALSLVVGCSSGSSGAPEDGGGDGSTPVSFQAEVVPIFSGSCALSASCHGDPSTAPLQPYFGSKDGGVDAETILTPIVSVPSAEDPSMNVITPGDPTKSYLQHKIDGDQASLAAACAGGPFPNCGSSMPFGAPLLDTASRDLIRAWISQGAKAN
jgi:hypothetical protein